MPVSVKKVGKKYRVVGPDGKIEKNKSGTAVDGGGYPVTSSGKKKAVKQVQAINLSMRRKKK